MRYIIEGKDVAKVLQENRIRVQRGVIKFTPLDDGETSEPTADDIKDVAITDDKSVDIADAKSPKTTKRTKKSE